MTLTCPVDGRENISEEFCPQCGADLRPLWRAKRLPEAFAPPPAPVVTPPPPSSAWYRVIPAFLAGAVLVGVVSYALRPPAPIPAPTPIPIRVIEYREKPAPTVSYRVRPGDSLWRIAADKYGSATYWKEIERVNQDHLSKRKGIFPGDTLMLPSITLTPRE